MGPTLCLAFGLEPVQQLNGCGLVPIQSVYLTQRSTTGYTNTDVDFSIEAYQQSRWDLGTVHIPGSDVKFSFMLIIPGNTRTTLFHV